MNEALDGVFLRALRVIFHFFNQSPSRDLVPGIIRKSIEEDEEAPTCQPPLVPVPNVNPVMKR